MSQSPKEKENTERYLDSTTSLWNGLFTINGIIFSVFSALLLSGNMPLSVFGYILVLLSIVSIWLLIFNLYAIKSLYYHIGIGYKDRSKFASYIEKKDANKRGEGVRGREKIVLLLLFFETLIILGALLYTYFGGC